MAFRVEYSSAAEADLESILDWLISEHAGQTGLRWFEGLETAVASLANLPLRCPLARENTRFPFEVRQLHYGRRPHVYRVLFTIDDERVVVLHIWHGRRERLRRPH